MAHENTEQQQAVRAQEIAAQMAIADEKARQERLRQRAGKIKAKKDAESGTVVLSDGRAVEPMAAFVQSAVMDITAIPSKYLKKDKDGPFMPCWVEKKDVFGADTDVYITLRQRYGYEVVLKENGKPLERRECIAMQAPASGVARWLLTHSLPGSQVYERASESLDELVESTNKRAGKRMAEVYTDESHGHENPAMVTLP